LIGVPDGAPYSIGVPDPGVWRAHRWHADHHRRPIKIGVPDPAPSPLYPQGEC